MTIQHLKHSTSEGNVPNLVPGQVGVNLLDDKLWFRTAGRKLGLALGKLRSRAAPSEGGIDGAPLVYTEGVAKWDISMVPSSTVEGEVTVDRSSPANIFGIPGIDITGTGDDYTLTAAWAVREWFYVASDSIEVDRVAFYLSNSMSGISRVGLFDASENLIYAANGPTAVDGQVTTITVSATLPTGWYQFVYWSEAMREMTQIEGYQYDQGWELDGSGDMLFTDRERAFANFSAGIDLSAVTWSPVTSPTPGVRRLFAWHWSIPT